MLNRIFNCLKCGNYTLKKICCGQETLSPKPARFKTKDKYSMQRLKWKAGK